MIMKGFLFYLSKAFIAVVLFFNLVSVAFSQIDFIKEALTDLKSPDPALRLKALGTLNVNGRASFELLISLIDDPAEEVRKAAVMNLGASKDKRAIDPLTRILRDKNPAVQVSAAWALGNIGDPDAVEPLLRNLETAELGIKFHIIEALGRLDDPRSVQPLFNLKNTDAGDYALKALGKSAVEPMCEILTRGSSSDRWYAIYVLERIADERATNALVSVLGVGESGVGKTAANTIAWRIGKPAVDQLIASLDDSNPQVRANVVMALAQIDDERTIGAIVSMMHDDSLIVRKQLIESLGVLTKGNLKPEDERVVITLVTAMHDKDPEVRLSALQGLSNIQNDNVIQAFIYALSDPAMSSEASLMLGARKDLRAIPYLLNTLKGDDPLLAVRAQQVLKMIGVPAVDGLISVLRDKNKEFPLRDIRRQKEQDDASKVFILRCGNEPPPPPKLGDPRVLAAYTLGEIGDKRAIEYLIDALKDKSPWLREASKTALEKLRN